MTNPLISICIPTYNGDAFIRHCLESCLAQTVNNYEIIICDDGSNDNTVNIINEYLKKTPCIRFYKNETNLGLVGNWNKCLSLAKGVWIKFLFQDDEMTVNCLQVFSDNITENAKLLVCKRNFILEKNATIDKVDYYTNRVRTLENTGFYSSNSFSSKIISKIAAKNISLNFIGEPSLALFKKDVLDAVGCIDLDLKQICDLEFLLRIASNYGLTYIPKKLCAFRIHRNSTTEKNITGKEYRLNYIETLYFAIKLASKPEFSTFRQSINYLQFTKLKAYIKYKSYIAFKAISDKEDEKLFNELKQNYQNLFFKPYECYFLKLVAVLKP
jgi:glycosyltransferase involved in cell wall biosynthesis